jgi:hypothetical protein
MRAVLIDPYLRTITQIDFGGTRDALYQVLGVQAATSVVVGPRDILWHDSEAFREAGRPVFRLGESTTPLAGRGLILGNSSGREYHGTTLPLAKAVKTVHWTDYETTGDVHMGGVAPGDDGEFYGFVIRVGSPVLRKRVTKGT